MRFLLALICSITALWAQEESKLPLEAQKLIAAYDTDAAKIRADAEKQVEKKSAELADKLAKVQESATKRGDLDGAVALKAKIAALGGKGKESGPVVDAPRMVHAVPRMKQREWDDVPGEIITVLATKGSTPTGITLTADDLFVLVPSPSDQWTQGPVDKYTKVRWDSGEMQLCWKAGNGETFKAAEKDGLLIRGEGALVLMGSDTNCGDNWGSIRVKIVRAAK